MNDFTSLEEWYTKGSFAPLVRERRLITSSPIWMFDVCQPAGDYPDPALEEVVLIQDKKRARTVCDLGSGRFVHHPGGVVVVPRRSATQFTVSNAHHIRVLGFSSRALSEWTEVDDKPDLGHLHTSSMSNQFVHHLLDRIWDSGSINSFSTALYSDAVLITLWAELLREARRPFRPQVRGGLAGWQIRRVDAYLNDHVHENTGLTQLAGEVGLSPFHFSRAFKKSLGVAPHQYQLSMRLKRAKALLVGTSMPVTDVAFQVGFESSQALARLFRREVGITPSEYRRQHRS